MSDRIPMLEPTLGGNEGAYLAECVASGYVSSVGSFVTSFEEAFAQRVGLPHAVACSTGTAALHLALRATGVGDGDEVWVSDLTFIASANPIRYERAVPVLVDADLDTWQLDLAAVMAELDRRAQAGERMPKAIIAAHILGWAVNLAELRSRCDTHGVVLIEDAAEAFGATVDGRAVGTHGHVACYSFNGNKIVTAGGGGMLVSEDEGVAARARHLSTQARVAGAHYFHDDVGHNYRLTNIAAAVGLAQLEQLDGFLENKRRIAERYDEAFSPIEAITTPPKVDGVVPSHWLYTILVPDRDRMMADLDALFIAARPMWTPLRGMPPFKDAGRLTDGDNAPTLAAAGLCLPSSAHLSSQDQERVIEAVCGAMP